MISTELLERSAKYSGDPWVSSNPYFTHAEGSMNQSWAKRIWPFIQDCDFSAAIDLAAGHGRNSEKLLERAGSLVVMDIQAGNVEICRKRFAGRPNVKAMLCNGFDLQPVEDDSITLVYCFDAMVHFNPDVVQSYLADTHRVLKPGGRGFFHHSNYTGGKDWKLNPASRNYMSAAMFADKAKQAGLSVVRQVVIDWSNHRNLDCLSLVQR